MSSSSSPWIKQIEHALGEARIIPLWGHPPAFPKELFSEKMAEIFPHFIWKEIKTDWAAPDHLLAGFGEKPIILTLELAPLSGPIFWIISREDVAALTGLMLTTENGKKGFSDPRLQEGYYKFLILEVLSLCQLYPTLTPRIIAPLPLPQEMALCHDITWSIHSKPMRGRLVIPSDFHRSFRAYFEKQPLSLASSKLSTHTMLSLGLEAGSTILSYEKWKQLKVGDLLLLDRCSYDPKEKKGSVEVVLGKIPLFRGRIKHLQFKVLEDAFFYEEQNHMDEKNPENDDEEYPLDEGEPQEDESQKEEMSSEEETNHLWSTKDGGNELIEKRLSSHDLPLVVTVEVGRVQMSIEKLLQLQPGNMVDLARHPEQQVDLTVQGRRVAKGELVKIGEAIGVKILSLE